MQIRFVNCFPRRFLGATCALLVTLAAAKAQAATIAFNDFGPGNSYGVSGLGIGGGPNLSQGGAFISGATGELSEIITAIVVGTSPAGSGYSLSLYADNSNSPGTLLGSFGGFAPAAPGTSDILTPSSGIVLTSGQKYWLIASAPGKDMNWRQNNQSVNGPWYYHDGSGTTFVSSTTLVAFKVFVVPEPPSAALAAVGVATVLFCRGRRRLLRAVH
jgi:hypothetical protein